MEEERNPHPQNPLWQFVRSVEDYIEQKYKIPQPRDEGRRDAMLYAISQLAWYKLEPFSHADDYEENELQERNKIVDLWDKGIEKAIRGDWSGIRIALQDYIRSSSNASTIGDFLPNATRYSESSEKRATSLIHLANSLI